MGNQAAGRVVLQALIGRMVRMAQRDPRAGIDDYLARLCCVINSYPLQRRPARQAWRGSRRRTWGWTRATRLTGSAALFQREGEHTVELPDPHSRIVETRPDEIWSTAQTRVGLVTAQPPSSGIGWS